VFHFRRRSQVSIPGLRFQVKDKGAEVPGEGRNLCRNPIQVKIVVLSFPETWNLRPGTVFHA
jgi:hypothetical protein